jgi:uncharacterized protein (DUF1800 family)
LRPDILSVRPRSSFAWVRNVEIEEADLMSQLQGAIAAARFGMGARPGEIAAASSDPRGWLKAQIGPSAALIPGDGLLSVKQVFAAPAARSARPQPTPRAPKPSR